MFTCDLFMSTWNTTMLKCNKTMSTCYVSRRHSFFSTIIKEHRKHLHFSVYTKQHLTAVFKEDQVSDVLPDRLNAQQTKKFYFYNTCIIQFRVQTTNCHHKQRRSNDFNSVSQA